MFTQNQILEIVEKIEALGKKDSEFPPVNKLDGKELIPVLHKGRNRLASMSLFETRFWKKLNRFFKDFIRLFLKVIDTTLNKTVTLTVKTNVDGAKIIINGEEQSSISVQIGTAVQLSITADSYAPYTATINVFRDQDLIITLVQPYIYITPEDIEITTSEEAAINVISNEPWHAKAVPVIEN